jgi:hypothetical protein
VIAGGSVLAHHCSTGNPLSGQSKDRDPHTFGIAEMTTAHEDWSKIMNRSTIVRAFAGAFAGALPLLLLSAQASAQDTAQAAPRVTQICLAPAAVEAAPNGVDPLGAVRETFTSFLSGPSLGVAPLNARLQSQVREEAKLASCRYLLLTTVKHERKTGGGGLLGRVAGGAVQHGAWSVAGATGSTVGRVVAGAAAGAASSAAYDYAASSRNKDELTLTYRLESAGTVLVEKSGKRKAKSDGEDLLTPLVQRASEAIANAVTARGPAQAAP